MPNIEVSEEAFAKIKDQFAGEFEVINLESLEGLVGKKLFIRTVTYHLVGKVEKIVGNIIQLSTASWVADSGRFMNAIKNGELDEVEPLGEWFINFNSVVDFGEWKHVLPTQQK